MIGTIAPLDLLAARSVEAPCLTKGLDLPCWVTGSSSYSLIRVDGRAFKAHRYAYRGMVGEIPEGLEPDHLCRRPACWNPYHLDPVTHRVNVLRGRARAWHLSRTHCPHGHEYTSENTRIHPNGGRDCRACNRGPRRPKVSLRKTGFCIHGHRWDDVNTYIRPDGRRECRKCTRAHGLVRDRARRLALRGITPCGGAS